MRIPRRHLEEQAAERPADYLDVCSAAGIWEGNDLVLTDEAYAALVTRYAHSEPLRPGMLEMARHFSTAIVAWASAGFPVVSAVQFHGRAGICRECDHYLAVPVARCGVCGCSTSLKPWLATERCPKGKW